MKYEGSCLCGDVTFEIKGEFDDFYLCHCSRCRKDTGSAYAANLFSATAKLNWLSGEDLVKVFNYQTGRHIKSFCSNCGSALPNYQFGGRLLVVPAGCLDSNIWIKPQGHIFWNSKANWYHELEKLPKFEELPDNK